MKQPEVLGHLNQNLQEDHGHGDHLLEALGPLNQNLQEDHGPGDHLQEALGPLNQNLQEDHGPGDQQQEGLGLLKGLFPMIVQISSMENALSHSLMIDSLQ